MKRDEHLARLRQLPADIIESIAVVIESADAQGDYIGSDDEGSSWEDDANRTLAHLAEEIRRLKATR